MKTQIVENKKNMTNANEDRQELTDIITERDNKSQRETLIWGCVCARTQGKCLHVHDATQLLAILLRQGWMWLYYQFIVIDQNVIIFT